MFNYAPPAGIDDLAGRPTRASFLHDWHNRIKASFDDEISRLPPSNNLFFSEASGAATSADLPVTWNAFPLAIRRLHPSDANARWSEADQLRSRDRRPENTASAVPMPFRAQDEYCEWHAYRSSPGGNITRIVFTAEAPEYWIELAKHDFDLVVELYRRYVSPLVQADDLRLRDDIEFDADILKKGSYNPYNEWNVGRGAMHLTHPANTLGAEINLTARATIPRRDKNGARITEVRRFACGSDFGDPNRSSDPNIGLGVNLTAIPLDVGSPPQSITLANPVALYIDSIASGVITDKDGNPLVDWFKIVRGVTGRGLMAVLEPPPGADKGLDEVHIVGDPLTHGGQVAEHIQMILYAKTASFGHPMPPLETCSRHCCRPNTPAPTERLNLLHPAGDTMCGGTHPDNAFPELLSLDAAGVAPPLPPAHRGASRIIE